VSKKIYNKLVRSEIPTIIRESGKECMYGKLNLENNKDEIIKLLKEKLVEEAREVIETLHKGDLLEELGDLENVIYSLKKVLRVENDEVRTLSNAKTIKKGNLGSIMLDSKGQYIPLKNAKSRHDVNYEFIKLISVEDNGQETKD
jgi:predicted house-cleaning noncanonical NTP pyrophosphatase (MazG superfamily)